MPLLASTARPLTPRRWPPAEDLAFSRTGLRGQRNDDHELGSRHAGQHYVLCKCHVQHAVHQRASRVFVHWP